MATMNRTISSIQLQSSKERNSEAVMDRVNKMQSKSVINKVIFNRKYITAFAVLVVVLIGVTLLDFGGGSIPNPNPVLNQLILDEATTETLVELSYISASLMSTSFTVSSDVLMQLVKPVKATSIAADIDDVNSYFDMLKVFLEDDPFGDDILVEDLIDEDYQSKITFTSDGKSFVFYINIIEEDIVGLLYIDDIMYTVEGKQVIEETESKLQLRAINGNDYVDVEYITETVDLDSTQKFNVEKSINGVITKKNIKISVEDDSIKVTIEDLTSKYNLKKNTEDDDGKYMLDYTIDGEIGRATIYLDVDEENNPVYRYEIREGSITATILVPIPSTVIEEQSNPNTEIKEEIDFV